MWYPATPKNPQSATTFTCLRQFQNMNCLGKIPVYDYYKALEIMTQNRQREKPKVRGSHLIVGLWLSDRDGNSGPVPHTLTDRVPMATSQDAEAGWALSCCEWS
jgi:hypothetical protein